MKTDKKQNIISISLIITLIIIFLSYSCKNSFRYEDEIENDIDYVEIETDFGTKKLKKYTLLTSDRIFIIKLRELYKNGKNYSKEKERKMYYYSIHLKIFYKNGLVAKSSLLKDKIKNFYFLTYESKNVHTFYYECYKDENNQFQEIVDYIIENGERVQ